MRAPWTIAQGIEISQPIFQQDLKRCRLRTVPFCTSVVFYILGVVYALLAGIYGIAAVQARSVIVPYSDLCADTVTCLVPFNITETIRAPAAIYYRLTGFSQQRRDIASSYNQKMLKGEVASESDLTSCIPKIYDGDLPAVESLRIPCGLLPANVFTDSFTLLSETGVKVSTDDSDIMIAVDQRSYADPAPEYLNATHWLKDGGIFTGQTDPHFVVWMRKAAFTPFRKMYSLVTDDLPAGTYTMAIRNFYNATAFRGEKAFVIAETRTMGTWKYGPLVVFGVMSVMFMLSAVLFNILGRRRKLPTSPFHPDQLEKITGKVMIRKT